MTGYKIITIDSLCDAIGESGCEQIIAQYSCPRNKDIEDFLRFKAIVFSKQSLAKTHLVFTSYKEEIVLVGYFALANKTLFIPDKARLSMNLRKRLSKFATRIEETKMSILSAPLIAQLGKNYSNGYDKLISGDELLKMACETIQKMQLAIGGKIAYLECEDIPGLIQFYTDNGFIRFSTRELDKPDNKDEHYLVQMIKYFSSK